MYTTQTKVVCMINHTCENMYTSHTCYILRTYLYIYMYVLVSYGSTVWRVGVLLCVSINPTVTYFTNSTSFIILVFPVYVYTNICS